MYFYIIDIQHLVHLRTLNSRCKTQSSASMKRTRTIWSTSVCIPPTQQDQLSQWQKEQQTQEERCTRYIHDIHVLGQSNMIRQLRAVIVQFKRTRRSFNCIASDFKCVSIINGRRSVAIQPKTQNNPMLYNMYLYRVCLQQAMHLPMKLQNPGSLKRSKRGQERAFFQTVFFMSVSVLLLRQVRVIIIPVGRRMSTLKICAYGKSSFVETAEKEPDSLATLIVRRTQSTSSFASLSSVTSLLVPPTQLTEELLEI